ncbi:MAG: hypothetical protein AAF639_16615 [Chloroflexota bacterium]
MSFGLLMVLCLLVTGCAIPAVSAATVEQADIPLAQSISAVDLEEVRFPAQESMDDMAALVAEARPFRCKTNKKGVLICRKRTRAQGDSDFRPLTVVKVPPQVGGYDVTVVELPIYPVETNRNIYGKKVVKVIRDGYTDGQILDDQDADTAFKPERLWLNWAVVKVDPDTGEFDGTPESVLSEFDPPIEIRFQFELDTLMLADDYGFEIPRYGYWSYAFEPEDRKWVEFTVDRAHRPRPMLEVFEEPVSTAARSASDDDSDDDNIANGSTAVVVNNSDITEVETVSEAMDMLNDHMSPAAARVAKKKRMAVVINDPTGLPESMSQMNSNMQAQGNTHSIRISLSLEVSSWDDQTIGSLP